MIELLCSKFLKQVNETWSSGTATRRWHDIVEREKTNWYAKALAYLCNTILFSTQNFCPQGVKIKMDDAGNILVRRYSKSNVYAKSTASSPNEETAIGSEVLKSPNQSIDHDKVVKVSREGWELWKG